MLALYHNTTSSVDDSRRTRSSVGLPSGSLPPSFSTLHWGPVRWMTFVNTVAQASLSYRSGSDGPVDDDKEYSTSVGAGGGSCCWRSVVVSVAESLIQRAIASSPVSITSTSTVSASTGGGASTTTTTLSVQVLWSAALTEKGELDRVSSIRIHVILAHTLQARPLRIGQKSVLQCIIFRPTLITSYIPR